MTDLNVEWVVKIAVWFEYGSQRFSKAVVPQTVALILRKVMIYLLTSCNTEERIAQNIYIHNSNRNIKNQLQEQF